MSCKQNTLIGGGVLFLLISTFLDRWDLFPIISQKAWLMWIGVAFIYFMADYILYGKRYWERIIAIFITGGLALAVILSLAGLSLFWTGVLYIMFISIPIWLPFLIDWQEDWLEHILHLASAVFTRLPFFSKQRNHRFLEPTRSTASSIPYTDDYQEKINKNTIFNNWSWHRGLKMGFAIAISFVFFGYGRSLPSAILRGHAERVNDLYYSPDGQLIASVSYPEGTLRLWDLKTNQQLTEVNVVHPTLVAFSPDGQNLAVESDSGLRILDVDSQRFTFTLPESNRVVGTLGLAFSPNGKTLASINLVDSQRSFSRIATRLWDFETNEETILSPPYLATDGVNFVFSPDGKMIATRSGLGPGPIIWSLEPVQIQKKFEMQRDVHSFAFSPDSQLLAGVTLDGEILVWDVNSKELLENWHTGIQQTYAVRFDADGRTLLTGDCNNTIRRWDLGTGKQIGKVQLRPHIQCPVFKFSPDGKSLATDFNGNIFLWLLPKNMR